MQFIGAYILTISTFLLVCQEAFHAHFFVRKMPLDFRRKVVYDVGRALKDVNRLTFDNNEEQKRGHDMTRKGLKISKKIMSFMLVAVFCFGMSFAASANTENTLVEEGLTMPEAPATVKIPEEHQRVIEEGAGIELFKEVPENFVKPRAGTTPMTSMYDQRVVRLVIKFANSPYSYNYGTGFMIGNDSVATAAHNLKHPTYGRATSITCYIGAKSNGYAAATYTITNTSKFLRPSKWDSTGAYQYDYGVIKLPADVNVGYFGFGVYSNSTLSSNTFTLIGYGTNTYQSGAKSRLSNIGTYDFYYNINTRGGDSGSPVFYSNGKVAGIHAYGPATSDGLPSATRITSSVFNDLKNWKSQ